MWVSLHAVVVLYAEGGITPHVIGWSRHARCGIGFLLNHNFARRHPFETFNVNIIQIKSILITKSAHRIRSYLSEGRLKQGLGLGLGGKRGLDVGCVVVGTNVVVEMSIEVREKERNGKKYEVFRVGKCSFHGGSVLL